MNGSNEMIPDNRRIIYKRILEVLNDYWLSEPKELAVEIRMDFLKSDGQHQTKQIRWLSDEVSIGHYLPEPVSLKELIDRYSSQNTEPRWIDTVWNDFKTIKEVAVNQSKGMESEA